MYSTVKDYLYKDAPILNASRKCYENLTSSELQNEFGGTGISSSIPNVPSQPKTMIVDLEPSGKEKITSTSTLSQQNTSDPKVWGPLFWAPLHISAAYYPIEASPIVKERMKNRILAIPYEVPCTNCRVHASAFIEKNKDNLDTIVSGRHSLGKFYVDFHNQVNKRFNKPVWTYEDAYKVYKGNGTDNSL